MSFLAKVLLDDAISSVELVNCQRIKVQVRGSVPSVAVDKTDGFLCYLGKDGLETTFVTSKVPCARKTWPCVGVCVCVFVRAYSSKVVQYPSSRVCCLLFLVCCLCFYYHRDTLVIGFCAPVFEV